MDLAEVTGGKLRGGSTISQQTAKNVFLWQGAGWTRYVRKGLETWFTLLIETIWGKRRIMEVYLNVAEWGPGLFGIEAASQFRFGKPAKFLSPGQASRLAVSLPNPLARNPARPGPGLKRLARVVEVRMRTAPPSRTGCVLPRRRN